MISTVNHMIANAANSIGHVVGAIVSWILS